MASYFDEIARNRLKSALLMLAFGLFFAAIVYVFVLLLGGGVGSMIVGLVLIAAYALFSFYFGSAFVVSTSGAKEVDRKAYLVLYDIIEGLSAAMQVPMPKVCVTNDPSPNAFATGRDPKHSYVVVTSGLLGMMNRDELSGVLAHEMSHIADNDIQYMLVAVVFAGIIGIVAAIIRNMFFYGGFRVGGDRDRNGSGMVIMAIALVIGLLAPLFATLIRLAISRKREFMADANGARITRSPRSLASALGKIEKYDQSPQTRGVMRANEVTAPLYFASPFKASSLLNLFSTHPPIEERIRRLEAMY